MDKIIIQGLKTKCIIGDYDWEQKQAQTIFIDLEMETNLSEACQSDRLTAEILDYNRVAKTVLKFVEKSSYHLIEALAENIAQLCLQKFPIISIKVRLAKPAAIRAAEAAIVEIQRGNKG